MRRVVVTGIGAITPIGNDAKTFLENVDAQKIGAGPITKFDASDLNVSLTGEVKDFEPTKRLNKKDTKRMDIFCQYGLYSAVEAMTDAGFSEDEPTDKIVAPERLGVLFGSGIGGITTTTEQAIKMHTKGVDRISPMFIPEVIANMAAGNIAIRYQAKNMCQCIVTACSSSTDAIGQAFHHIQADRADMMIAGGAEAANMAMGVGGFAALTAITKADDPTRASIPFDEDRAGFLLSEGAGTVILEDMGHALARGAKIYGEIVGYGSMCDAYHMTSPDPTGAGAYNAMNEAVREADITPAQVGYINAHGTSTKANDAMEAKAIQRLFGADSQVLVSSTKGMTGHLLGAAGAIEAIITLKALQSGQLPINVGVKNQDAACPVTLVSAENQTQTIDYALSNSFGFGGHDAVLALKKWRGV
ncbi:beta-ketoacyl-ACP synthase II [Agrilactobacillus yilanensis]|uniref:3-oxoacyl-[acyl-carrier-protein] synthase 2 n=1 Tax=Agrilactobacillus yilanensis TaxID=2485997 RepID=A0ABW4JAH3_9LACO|nr:beta-ketoacyl-ACP synthase II [Agrilactobacillus yilanensis]